MLTTDTHNAQVYTSEPLSATRSTNFMQTFPTMFVTLLISLHIGRTQEVVEGVERRKDIELVAIESKT